MVLPFSQDHLQLVLSVNSEQELCLLIVGRLNLKKKYSRRKYDICIAIKLLQYFIKLLNL